MSGGIPAQSLEAWLQLARTPRIGAVTFARLIDEYETADAALEALPSLTQRAQARDFCPPSRDEVRRELDAADQAGVSVIAGFSPDYPHALSVIPDPPPLIFAKGQTRLLEPPGLAIVGARNASAAGMRFARELAHGCGMAGVTITSGLARGIDGAAHLGAVDTGTIAVLAGGLDHVYPPEHDWLYAQIAEMGCLVSEMPLGMTPTARDFPRRNRIISGLSMATLVVEAALKSGSLVTARLANEQGREVMAIPGSPLDPRAKGTNRLLREGASLIESVEDVLDLLGQLPQPARPLAARDAETEVWACLEQETSQAPAEASLSNGSPAMPAPADGVPALSELVSPAPVSLDELARLCGRPAGEVQAEIFELELSGQIKVLPGGMVQKTQ